MENMVRYHEKILDFLIKWKDKNPDFYFVTRKINNKGRLDKGYWFLGNSHYAYISFWDGTDTKEKVHNIGFVVLKDKTSYIELSAQDSDKKALFLDKLAKKIGGFERKGTRNKWFKFFEGKEFIHNLTFFLENVKPQIDALLKKEKPKGIKFLDEAFHQKKVKKVLIRREKQIAFGEKNKVARICWNTKGWRRPSGPEGKSKSLESYEKLYGYGHEEWLFDQSKVIDGFHYAFIEPLRLKTDRHEHNIYNITLFTINNLNKKYLVGEIANVECITPSKSVEIYQEYKERGYIDEMQADVEEVAGEWETFIFTEPAKFFNIRFKFKDVNLVDELEEISDKDINITTNRFKLLPKKGTILNETIDETIGLLEGNKRNTRKRKKVFNVECEYDPDHDKMQNLLKDLLDQSGKYKIVQIERNRVDIKGLTIDNKWHYFEIKTDNPKLSIRKAIGQIMEYAYYPNLNNVDKLIIVAQALPDADTVTYLEHLRNTFNLPISYRGLSLETKELSIDY